MGKLIAFVMVVLAVLVGIVYFLSRSEPEIQPQVQETPNAPQPTARLVERREIPLPAPEVLENYALSGELPLLNDSDSALFNHLRLLVTPIRLQLLKDDQLIRKFVLQVDNAANGELIYQHSPLVSPEGGIAVIETDENALEIDPESYARYDRYADLAGAVDVSLLVAYYQFYEPLLDEAYMELGYSEGDFRFRLIGAIDQVLSVPVVEGSVLLEQPEVNFIFSDPALEGLNTLQKQLLRMGPENTQKIQLALQQFKARIQ